LTFPSAEAGSRYRYTKRYRPSGARPLTTDLTDAYHRPTVASRAAVSWSTSTGRSKCSNRSRRPPGIPILPRPWSLLAGIRRTRFLHTGLASDLDAALRHSDLVVDGLTATHPQRAALLNVASTLLLQSDHPGSSLYVATGDINMQTKLADVGVPFVELP
jgi:hypothetical protein